MKTRTLLAALAGAACSGAMAKADFVLYETVRPITAGQFAGDTAWTFQIVNTGTDITGGTTKLAGVDLWLEAYQGPVPLAQLTFYRHNPAANGQLFIRTSDQDGSGTADDADLANQANISAPENGSYIRFGTATTWTIISTTPPLNSPDDGVTPSSPVPYTDGQSIGGSFEMVGASSISTNGSIDTTPRTLAVAVVPPGDTIRLVGSVGAEAGQPIPLDTAILPEPASFGLIGLGLGALALCRRRA